MADEKQKAEATQEKATESKAAKSRAAQDDAPKEQWDVRTHGTPPEATGDQYDVVGEDDSEDA